MAQTTAPPGTPSRRGSTGVLGLVGAGAVLAALIAAVLTLVVGGPVDAVPGLSNPDRLTTIGLPAVRALAEISMAVAVGALLLAAFLVPPQRSGFLDVAGYRAVRSAAAAAFVWALAAALMVPLTVADTLGRPLDEVLDVGLLAQTVPRLSSATAWLATALIALVVLAACRTVLGWGWTVVTFGLSLLGPLPVTLTGHSASGGAHDVASDSLMLHVLAACLWVGGLIAVLGTAAARGPDRAAALETAVPRFSRMALVCWVVVGLTGVVNALVRVAPADLFTTAYGALVVGKAVALGVLGLLGLMHRRRTVARAAAGEVRALVRLAAVEIVLMLATIGLAVALGRSAPPAPAAGPPSRTEVLIGYDLTAPPTALRLLLDWRFDLIFGTAAFVLAAVYLAGVRRLRRRGDAWPVGRTLAWLCGCAALLVSTSSGIGRYGPAMFSVHMAEHMILSMLVPILLVLGAPVTLALRALPPAGRAGPAGPREWLLAAVHSPWARFFTHPLVALPVLVGS
jgi:putative copper resistance protein D